MVAGPAAAGKGVMPGEGRSIVATGEDAEPGAAPDSIFGPESQLLPDDAKGE